jgi:hypothetical protein
MRTKTEKEAPLTLQQDREDDLSMLSILPRQRQNPSTGFILSRGMRQTLEIYDGEENTLPRAATWIFPPNARKYKKLICETKRTLE